MDMSRLLCTALATLAGLAAGGPAWAQYKVVDAEGRVTYTDRPPADTRLRVTPLGQPAAAAAATQAGVNLPVELRQLTQRYPVTLYTSGDCAACDSGRQWLNQRGVPYRERSVSTEQDAQALMALIGARTVPALTIGAQPVRGFSETDWGAFLDAAGYPRENKLPRGWQPPAVTALVEPPPRPAVAAAPSPRAPAPAAAPAAPPLPPPGSVRF